MKKILFSLLALFLFCGCSKDESDDFDKSYLIDYVVCKNYTQTFYFTNWFIHGYDSVGMSIGFCMSSICNRLSFQMADDEDGFYEICPPTEKMNEVIELNNESKGKELQYYLIADFEFLYVGSVEEPKLKDAWRIVIGKEEEYIFKGKIYNRIVIVSVK